MAHELLTLSARAVKTLFNESIYNPGTTQKASITVLLCVLLWAAASSVLLHRYVFAIYVIRGSSMSPTLKDGDTALVNMLIQRGGSLERGEIVLVEDGFRDYATKRIVGLPGERIDIREGHVYVNTRLLSEIYLPKHMPTLSACPTFVLGAEQYFVLGDNRSDSYDSRIYGPVSRQAIMGSYSRTFWACR